MRVLTTCLAVLISPAVVFADQLPGDTFLVDGSPGVQTSPLVLDNGAICYLDERPGTGFTVACKADYQDPPEYLDSERPTLHLASDGRHVLWIKEQMPGHRAIALDRIDYRTGLFAQASVSEKNGKASVAWEEIDLTNERSVWVSWQGSPAVRITGSGELRRPVVAGDYLAYEFTEATPPTPFCSDSSGIVVTHMDGTEVFRSSGLARPDLRDVSGRAVFAFETADGVVYAESGTGGYQSGGPNAKCRHSDPRLSPDGRFVLFTTQCVPEHTILEMGDLITQCTWQIATLTDSDDRRGYDISRIPPTGTFPGDTRYVIGYASGGDIYTFEFWEVPEC